MWLIIFKNFDKFVPTINSFFNKMVHSNSIDSDRV